MSETTETDAEQASPDDTDASRMGVGLATAGHTPGPWALCFHLVSHEQDASCPCGFRGDIWGPDLEHVICEMGSTSIPEEMGLAPPRYPRLVELANARLIAAAPELLAALEALVDEQNGPPLLSYETNWRAAMDSAFAAIAKATAPAAERVSP